jgi:hypothetical protein
MVNRKRFTLQAWETAMLWWAMNDEPTLVHVVQPLMGGGYMTKKMHIPREGYGGGFWGYSYCRRWENYMTVDWASIKRSAASDDGTVFCRQCLKAAFPKDNRG